MTTQESLLIQVRIPVELNARVRHWAVDRRLTLSAAVEVLLENALTTDKERDA